MYRDYVDDVRDAWARGGLEVRAQKQGDGGI
jgi:hypothetical protein